MHQLNQLRFHRTGALVALFTASLIFETDTTVGQGTIHFSTYVPGVVDAPVTYRGMRIGPEFWGQLYGAPPGQPLMPLGIPVEFRGDHGRGYITAGGTLTAPGDELHSVDVKLAVWMKWLGNDYRAAQQLGAGGWGESGLISVFPNTSLTATPASLVGLQGFEVPLIPEPTMAPLIAVGMALLALRKTRAGDKRAPRLRSGRRYPLPTAWGRDSPGAWSRTGRAGKSPKQLRRDRLHHLRGCFRIIPWTFRTAAPAGRQHSSYPC
jgi:hypothetical protein